MRHPLAFVFCLLPAALMAEDVIKDSTYNLPPEVAASMGTDAVMKKMETAVKPEVLAEFRKQHPAKFWLFGEDRSFAVRNHIIPAHWFEPGAKHYQNFSGTARPGEFYVFQVCVVPGEDSFFNEIAVRLPSLEGIEITVFSGPTKPAMRESGWSGTVINEETCPPDRRTPVIPVWIGLQIPATAKPGVYPGEILFRSPRLSATSAPDHPPHAEQLRFDLAISAQPIKNSGVDEAWRMARLKWLNSDIGMSDKTVTRPFTPVKVNEQARTLDILGRRVTLAPNGIPAQVTSYFSASNTKILATGRDAFATPPALACLLEGKPVEWKDASLQFHDITPTGVSWRATSDIKPISLEVSGRLEFDGFMSLSVNLTDNRNWTSSAPPLSLDDVRLTIPWREDVAKYAMGLGLTGRHTPAKFDWKWDVKKHQDALWIGDVNLGAMLRFKGANFRRPLINAYYDFQPLNPPDSWGGGGVHIENGTVTAYSGQVKIPNEPKGSRSLSFRTDWYLTPFKPLNTKQHFTDRYYHIGQHAANEDTAKLKAEGANIVEIHHNRLCNPYINYPFNDDSLPRLKEFVKKAHGDGMRVNLYYTTRELTQNLPEFFALKSMGGEIILPRKEGVAWPVTNPQGPHPWLKAHVGEDIVPAWRENLKFPDYPQKLDLAMITTPDSRWNNFYLEGLDYLVRNAGIDGLYIDDTALDRASMQRARRILDADGNTGRRVNMHSWNHHNGLAKWSNSPIAFMELYPYYDGLWHGEGFNADSPPEYMLVEMSGIPFGLMSEMLDHPNPWHGMVFGMRTRWPWSGDPRAIWKLEDAFGIAGSEFIGWWDPACPVKTNHPQVKASVYQKEGRAFVSIASWAKEPVKVRLEIDWRALGADPAKARANIRVPACEKLQAEGVITPDAEIPLHPNQGIFVILG